MSDSDEVEEGLRPCLPTEGPLCSAARAISDGVLEALPPMALLSKRQHCSERRLAPRSVAIGLQGLRRQASALIRPWYSLHERVVQLRASAASIDDELDPEVMELSRDEVKAHFELLSYHDTAIQLASYLDICGRSGNEFGIKAKEDSKGNHACPTDVFDP